MDLDLAIPDQHDDPPYDPESPRSSFWNRVAAAEKSAYDTYGTFAKGGSTTHFGSCLLKPADSKSQRPPTPPRPSSDSKYSRKHSTPGTAEQQHGQLVGGRAHSARGTSLHRPPTIRRSAPEMRPALTDVLEKPLRDIRSQQADVANLKLEGIHPTPNRRLPDIAPPLLSPRSSLDDDRLSRHSSHSSDALNDPAFWRELESRWILNLSMAFRDDSDREKFFITYAEEPNRWRRVTVSIDYRNKPADSLEADLKSLPFQRDKSAHIYEAIHESLPNVQFFDTVTNLKLETSDGRLHVHVTKDENEIIKYPPVDAVGHLDLGLQHEVLESDIHFQSHLSGFVYKVLVKGKSYIKKEIPGPDMIDEFLYEVNALWNLRDSPNVIDFCAIVLDEKRTCIKGLLISYADRGTLVDIIYDHRDPPLPWAKRDRWARQIVSGLADIHEHGFVQGDFTLSNIVIDDNDDVRIIDINRRGCPVGWEPPEFQGLIDSGQRISMYIGTKSDLYQLGMVLWALAKMDDEPERAMEPLMLDADSGAPSYLMDWVDSCLAEKARDRLSAKELLNQLTHVSQMPATAPMGDVKTINGSTLVEDIGTTTNHIGSETIGQARRSTHELPEREIKHEDADVVVTTHSHPMPKNNESHTISQQQRSFLPPLHQDSGLPDVDDVAPVFRPPLHQDSGFADDFIASATATHERHVEMPEHPYRSYYNQALFGTGGQFG